LGADLLSIGRSGLNVSKKSLETTSHNIANANTEGYSRQIVRAETNAPIGEGSYVVGTGANVQSIKREHDELVEKKLNSATSGHSFNEERVFQLGKVEEIFNEVNSEGLNKILNRFFNSFRELANQPENETVRSIVRENAKIVASDFRRVRETLTQNSESINKKIEASVLSINSHLTTIGELNKEIAKLEVGGMIETGDLRDQRDLAVKSLSEFFKVQTYQDEKGQYVVAAEGVGALVAGGAINELKVGRQLPKNALADEKGDVQIFFKSRQGNSITHLFRGGSIGADVKTRDDDIFKLEKEIDSLAFNLAHATNAIHRRGFKNIQYPEDPPGQPIITPDMGQVTGINFFETPKNMHRAAEYLDLSSAVKEDLNNIATGLEPNKPGDNRIAIAVSKLQHEKVLGNGTTTFEEQYLKSVGGVGLSVSKAKIDTEQSSGILAQARTLRERISGVSLDEEAANMVKYQHAYEASARVIRSADDMFKAVLAMMD
jgi:flagellar hook-associated protein 1 FlgK